MVGRKDGHLPRTKRKLSLLALLPIGVITCKVNESMFINTSGFKDIVKKHRLKLLQGDLTRSDEKITNFLKKNGLIGIPAYFIQKSDGTLINLRETITLGKIRRNLK